MRPRFEAHDPDHRSNIIDVEANPPADAPSPASVPDDEPRAPRTFRERHTLKILGAVMVTMFALVIITQVGC